jgi:hypothetical protein
MRAYLLLTFDIASCVSEVEGGKARCVREVEGGKARCDKSTDLCNIKNIEFAKVCTVRAECCLTCA